VGTFPTGNPVTLCYQWSIAHFGVSVGTVPFDNFRVTSRVSVGTGFPSDTKRVSTRTVPSDTVTLVSTGVNENRPF